MTGLGDGMIVKPIVPFFFTLQAPWRTVLYPLGYYLTLAEILLMIHENKQHFGIE